MKPSIEIQSKVRQSLSMGRKQVSEACGKPKPSDPLYQGLQHLLSSDMSAVKIHPTKEELIYYVVTRRHLRFPVGNKYLGDILRMKEGKYHRAIYAIFKAISNIQGVAMGSQIVKKTDGSMDIRLILNESFDLATNIEKSCEVIHLFYLTFDWMEQYYRALFQRNTSAQLELYFDQALLLSQPTPQSKRRYS